MNGLSILGVLGLFIIMADLGVECVRRPRIHWATVGLMAVCSVAIGVLVWLA